MVLDAFIEQGVLKSLLSGLPDALWNLASE